MVGMSRKRGRSGGSGGRGQGRRPPAEQPTGLRRHLTKLAAGAGTLALVGVTAMVTGIGEAAANRLVSLFSPAPTSTTSPAPTSAPEPLTVAVRTDIGTAGDSLALRAPVNDGPVAATLLAGHPEEPWETFLDGHDGAPVGTLVVSLVFTGHRDPEIRVIGIEVERAEGGPVLAGTLVKLTTQGETESIKLAANLDEARPRLLADGEPYFPDGNITLRKGEQETLKLTLTAAERYHRWSFLVHYVDETGAARTAYVDRLGRTSATAPTGELFSLTGPARRYGARWVENYPIEGFHRR